MRVTTDLQSHQTVQLRQANDCPHLARRPRLTALVDFQIHLRQPVDGNPVTRFRASS